LPRFGQYRWLIDYFSAYRRVRRQLGQTYGTGVRISSARILLRNPSSDASETIESVPMASVPCNSICSNDSSQSGQTFSEGMCIVRPLLSKTIFVRPLSRFWLHMFSRRSIRKSTEQYSHPSNSEINRPQQ